MDDVPQQADWRRWLEEHAPKFLLFARQQARSEADAQDLVQEAVVEASRWQRDGRPPPPAALWLNNARRVLRWCR
jgi:RNA polymerase sigma-70 factor (ECF subfamily)